MHRFGMLITRITLLLVLFVMLVNLLLHRPLLDSFLFSVALAVGLTPELLPMVVSVTLARGAMRMARRRVIVKRMASIQNLGAMDVLCTDKTGTLTEGLISLARCIDGDGRDSAHVLMLAYLNSVFETGLRSPMDRAVLARSDVVVRGWRKVDEVPFDFERRRISVLVEQGEARWLVVKGAPDDVLALCSRCERGVAGGPAPLDASARVALRSRCQDLEREGLRVLGVAWRAVPPDHPHADVRDEHDLVFAGFAAFIDPPKPGAGAALAALAHSGVAVKIVTGDSELVTQHLCRLLKLPVKGVLTGRELARMDDAALRARLSHTTLFCRVNPTQKHRIVQALRANGHVVGYLGDGVNDAPPLHSADVGITVDSAVDVAREVADMVMLKRDLGVLHDGVLEGRRTFGNVMKYIMMGTSSNVGNMVSMAGASLFLPFLPLLPTQILLNNLLYDLSQAALPLDRVDAGDLRRPRALDMVFIRRHMALFGLISSAFDALTFWILLRVLQAGDSLFRTGWFIESLVSQVLVVFVIRTRGRPWASHP
jgi:Mg2+-importing ATPase